MSSSARCPECTWALEPPRIAIKAVNDVRRQLEGHLSGEHDWTWQRAHEVARSWSKTVIPALDATEPHAAPVSRTAKCTRCNFEIRASNERLTEILRCTDRLEQHLKEAHQMPEGQAMVVTESWALALVRSRLA